MKPRRSEKNPTAKALPIRASVSTRWCEDCDKQLYASERSAKATARTRMSLGSPRLYVYECPLYRGWHLTSQESMKRSAA